jgi:hypothetical protein
MEQKEFREFCRGKVFIHIPKCGGMAMWTHLKPRRPVPRTKENKGIKSMHATMEEIAMVRGDEFITENEFFTVVRDPFARAVSWYHFASHPHQPRHGFYKKFKSFKQWVMEGCPTHWKSGINVWSQRSWLTIDDQVALPTNHIFRLEDITEFMPKHNSSKHKDPMHYHNRRTIQKIAEMCSEDLELFDYPIPVV